MRNNIIYTLDVEPDLHSGEYKGIKNGLLDFEKLCDKHNIKPILFVVASTIKDNKDIYLKLIKKGWEISLHGYSHKRFDDMSYSEKEGEIKKSVDIFKKILKIEPKGFRAPQHSIDNETLDLLDKYGFEYDSSFTPLNFMQFLFFPKRPIATLRLFFSKPWSNKIRKNLLEMPVCSLILPPVSLIVRIFPKWFLYFYFKILKLLYKEVIFYAHSWDFIEMKKSKIDRMFPHTIFIEKLDYVMGIN